MPRPPLRFLLPLLAALLALSAAPPADAATVSVGGGILQVTASPGERNDLLITSVDADTLLVAERGSLVALQRLSAQCVDHGGGVARCDGASQISVDAGDGADVVTVASGITMKATIVDGPGDDTITGGAGNDTFVGSPGDDTLTGGAGNDGFGDAGGDGADTLDGGAGTDTADYTYRATPIAVTLDGQRGDGAAAERDDVKATVEQVFGGAATDTLVGGSGDELLRGNGGDDVLDGRGGADRLQGDGGRDVADYRSRTVRVVVTADGVAGDGAGENDNVLGDVESILGGTGDDDLTGNAGAGTIDGGAGDDTVRGGGGDDAVRGGDGRDDLDGGLGDDTLDGGAGADRIAGGTGSDVADYAMRSRAVAVDLQSGAAGEPGEGDTLTSIEGASGGAGTDRLLGDDADGRWDGGGGDDVLDGRGGADRMAGGAGWDRVDYATRRSDITVWINDSADDGASGERDDVRRDVEQVVTGSGHDRFGGDDSDEGFTGGAGNDQAWGNAGDDRLDGGSGADQLDGGSGDDQVSGGDHDDRMTGGEGSDTLDAGSGNDTAYAGAGDDRLDAGPGHDRATGDDGHDTVDGRDGNDQLDGGRGNDVLLGGAGNDKVWAGDGDDRLDGQTGDDQVEGAGGADHVSGADGNDKVTGGDDADLLSGGAGVDDLHGGNGADTVDGGAGADDVNGGAGNDTVIGGDGDDEATGEDGDDRLDGGLGNDVLHGARGDDALVGADGDDRLNGNDGADALDAGPGRDRLSGGGGPDGLIGGPGNDVLAGDGGDDRLDGGEGDDELLGGDEADVLAGGPGADRFRGDGGEDTADYAGRTEPLRITNDGKADDGATGEGDNVETSVDHVIGGQGNDLIRASNDWPHRLYGEGGNDTLDGGPKGDMLVGGAGNDQLIGRGGKDTFDAGVGDDKLSGADGVAETLRCGVGNDSAVRDAIDKAVGCEKLRRGSAPAAPAAQDVAPVAASPGRQVGVKRVFRGGRFVAIPGSPGERIDRRLLKDIAYLKAKYQVAITDGYALHGHSRDGEHPRGLAVDVVPGAGGSWSDIDRLAKWAEPRQNGPRAPFRFVGYNGDPGHGRGHHLHLSWRHATTARAKPAKWVEVLSFASNRPTVRVSDLTPLARRTNRGLGGAPSVRSGAGALPRCQGPAQLMGTWKAAGRAFKINWKILAAITEIESGFGCNMGPSSAGALGWTQFMPATWKSWGMDADGDGKASPYSSADAIFSSARYLRASGAPRNYRKAIFAYNHAHWYVTDVLKRSRRF